MDSGAAVVVGRGAALFVLLVVLPLAITHGTHKTRELEDAWRKLAERHHLRYERRSRYKLPSISGELDGRALHIKGESGKDTAPICVQLTLHGPLPEGLHIGPHEARVEVLGHVVVSGGINTGHSAFDEEVGRAVSDGRHERVSTPAIPRSTKKCPSRQTTLKRFANT